MKHPSAWVPIVLSITMLLIMVIIFSTSTVSLVREADEGVGAHLFQIWLVLEIILIPFFAIKWLLQRPKDASLILVIQIILVFIVCFPVFYFKL